MSGHQTTFKRKPKAAVTPEMNVTPLVDVVLVLLIIFMVLAPVVSAHYAARLPPPDEKDQELQEENDPEKPLVLRVEPDGAMRVGDVHLSEEEVVERIQRMLNARPNTLLYLDASNKAAYGAVLLAMEHAKTAGAHPVVLVAEEIPPDK